MPVPDLSPLAAGACPWADRSPLLRAFHDHEWSEPVAEAGILFEYLVLHTFQLGFDFPVVLKRREGFRELLAHFDPDRLARWGEDEIAEVMLNPRILRNRRKVEATVQNAQSWLRLRQEVGGEAGLLPFFYAYVGGRPVDGQRSAARPAVYPRKRGHEPRPEAARVCNDGPGELLQHYADCGPGQRPLAQLPPARRMRWHGTLAP